MGYQLENIPSPNYTPASQVQAFYGRPRVIQLGAGHWWGDPNAGYSHDGVVNGFKNPARQVAAHLVVSAGRVTKMVDFANAAWCTASANPYTIAIEVDPRLYLGGNLANQIKETLCEAIADLIIPVYGNLEWRPHNKLDNSTGTQCNPLDWAGIRARALQIFNDKRQPAVKEVSRDVYNPVKKFVFTQDITLQNIPAGTAAASKVFPKGEEIDIAQKLTMSNGSQWYRTRYSSDNELATGFPASALQEKVVVPEWQRNIVDIADVKLTVLPAGGTNIINLNTGAVIAPLAKGTVVDIAKRTTVGGKEYLISSYSVTQNMPNGLLASDMGVPAEPPVNEKPEWLKNWRDITDVTMYTRVDAPLVDLLTGATIKTIPINTPVEIASATDWHGQPYMITKYSTDKQEARGLRVVDLSDKPIKEPETPVEPAPEQPDLSARVSIIEAFIAKLKELLAKIGINL